MQKTNIQYLTHTWNPIAMRCQPVSPGCAACWHLRTANRLCSNPAMPLKEREALAGTGPFVLRKKELNVPYRRKKPAVIGVQFMGDLYHEDIPEDLFDDVMAVISSSPQHTFLILTKRAERLSIMQQYFPWPNLWIGVTVCNQAEADAKIPELLKVPGKKWLSIEPMLGPIDLTNIEVPAEHDELNHSGFYPSKFNCLTTEYDDVHYHQPPAKIDAVVLGGESGPGARPGHPNWLRGVRDQCAAAGVDFYFKQWGEWEPIGPLFSDDRTDTEEERWADEIGRREIINERGEIWDSRDYMPPPHSFLVERVGTKKAGRMLDGRTHDELPWRTA